MKPNFTADFRKALEALNQKQLEAVESIEGPVMVVAGPGTGKTQLLAARIGNILDKGEVSFQNILCLTYTEAASVAMRQRLLKFIGPEAYNVNIFTFHGFCNSVIKDNIEYFGGYRDLQLISDLEKVDILHQIIDDFPDDHRLKRYSGNIYYEKNRLENLFNTMKQENWSPQLIIDACNNYEREVLASEDYLYKRNGKGYQKGDLNLNKVEKELKKFRDLAAAVPEFEKYNNSLLKAERIDYSDMILWVIDALKKHDELLLSYQERFQYILVDEYQDSNGAQNEIIDLLASYWGKEANIFVVGDDDQSIFRFQGANMHNIMLFKEKYSPRTVVLENNYRSSQEILNKAMALIDKNAERLVAQYPELTKQLEQSRTEGLVNIEPKFLAYYNEKHEEKGLINKILELKKQGVKLSEVAVIYRKHKNVGDIVKYLEYHNIPINLKRRINILEELEIKKLLHILKYIKEEYLRNHGGEYLLFELLHYDYFDLSPRDIGQLSIYCSRRTDETEDDIRWRNVMLDQVQLKKAGIIETDKILALGHLFEMWISNINNMTIQTLFEKILTEGKIIDMVMLDKKDKTWRLQLINSFFDFIKNETAKDPKLNLISVLELFEKMISSRIQLPLDKVFFAKEGVNFVTAHSSKGLEFEHVFIIKCFQKNWVEQQNLMFNFRFPKSLVPAAEKSDIEDDRRLFYVAMTRAKSHLYVSTAKMSNDDKDLDVAQFVYEAMEGSDLKLENMHLPDEEIEDYVVTLMKYKEGNAQLIDSSLIDKVLEDYKVSVTSLNKYLRCPLTFYFENILRVPLARSVSMGFGNAIHFALERFFIDIESRPEREIGTLDELVELFGQGMRKYASHFTLKEMELRSTLGKKLLNDYYKEYSTQWSLPKQTKAEYTISLTEYKGVPITGKIDRLDIYDDYVEVIDYKTGKPKNASRKLKPPLGDEDLGGDYWRQLVFYKMLLDGDNKNNFKMKYGMMDFIEPKENGSYRRDKWEVDPMQIEHVEKQLLDTYENINAHKFENGCGEEDCKWCDFVQSNFVLKSHLQGYQEDEENN